MQVQCVSHRGHVYGWRWAGRIVKADLRVISESQALSKRLSVESSHNCKVSFTEGLWRWNCFSLGDHFASICIAHRPGAWCNSNLVVTWLFTKENWIMKPEVETTWFQFKARTRKFEKTTWRYQRSLSWKKNQPVINQISLIQEIEKDKKLISADL